MNRPNSMLLRRSLILVALLAAACSSPSTPGTDDGGSDDAGQMLSDGGNGADGGDGGLDGGMTSNCVSNPKTYVDFVNSCTTVLPVASSTARLPLQLADGGLPPPQTWTGDAPPMDGNCGGAAPTADAGMKIDAGTPADAGI